MDIARIQPFFALVEVEGHDGQPHVRLAIGDKLQEGNENIIVGQHVGNPAEYLQHTRSDPWPSSGCMPLFVWDDRDAGNLQRPHTFLHNIMLLGGDNLNLLAWVDRWMSEAYQRARAMFAPCAIAEAGAPREDLDDDESLPVRAWLLVSPDPDKPERILAPYEGSWDVWEAMEAGSFMQLHGRIDTTRLHPLTRDTNLPSRYTTFAGYMDMGTVLWLDQISRLHHGWSFDIFLGLENFAKMISLAVWRRYNS